MKQLILCALWVRLLLAATTLPADDFNLPRSYPVDFQTPLWPLVADLTGDQLPDLLYISLSTPSPSTAQQLFYVRNLGNGAFAKGVTTNLTFPWLFCSGLQGSDLNGDGKVDLVISGYSGWNGVSQVVISTLLGDGQGGFGTKRDYVIPVTLSGNTPPGIGDFDGDGIVDLVFFLPQGFSEVLYLAKGMGDGSFAMETRSAVYTGTGMIQVRDYDGDGKQDVLLLDHSSGGPGSRILYGLGNGSFEAVMLPKFQGTSFRAGDVNGDGIQDFLGSGANGFRIYLGLPDRSYRQLEWATYYGSGGEPLTGDFDHDGKLDWALGGSILFGKGNGGFESYDYQIPCGIVATLDMDGDGIMDLLCSDVSSYGTGAVAVIKGRLDRGLYPVVRLPSPGQTDIELGDLDGDGRLDILVAHSGILLNRGEKWEGPFYVPPNASQLKDLDGDGRAELIGGQGWVSYADGRPYAPQSVLIWPGDGTTRFSAPPRQVLTNGYPSDGLRIVDMDGDGKFDIVGNGFVLYGKGGLGFDRVDLPASGPTWTYSLGMLVGDYDGDHKLDIFNTNGRFILWGEQGRTFSQTAATWFIPPGSVPRCGSADVNGDGRDEILCPTQSQLWIYRCDDRTNAQVIDRLDTGDEFTFADYDGDGNKEFVVGTTRGHTRVYRGPWSNKTNSDYALQAPASPRSADLNNDGRMDLVFLELGTNVKPPRVIIVYGSSGPSSLQGPLLEVSSTRHDFGSLLTGARATAKIELSNPGTEVVDLGGAETSPPFEQSSNCPVRLFPGQGCTIDVSFVPKATGTAQTQLTIFSSTKNETHVVKLQAFAADLRLEPEVVIARTRLGTRQQVAVRVRATTERPIGVAFSCATDAPDWHCAVDRPHMPVGAEARVQVLLTQRRRRRLSREGAVPHRVRLTAVSDIGTREVVFGLP